VKHIIIFVTLVLSLVNSLAMAQSPSLGAPAGGLAPDSGLTFGLPLLGGGLNGRLSVSASQGLSRTMATNAALATVQNGVPGFVFGGSVQPFVTGLIPVVAAGSAPNVQTRLSPVGRMLQRGDIQVRKGSDGVARLIVSDSVKPRVATEPVPDTVQPKNVPPNAFRRGIEKYAGSKR
jgi:hypothetical protein